MELFCPACQKKLIIEDEYAGQMMKCPMCQATFTAPTIPSYETSPSSLPAQAPPAPPAPPDAPPPSPGFAAPPPPPTGAPTAPPPPGQWQAGPPGVPTSTSKPFVPPARSTEHTGKAGMALNPLVMQWIPVAAVVLILVLSMFTPWIWIQSLSFFEGPGYSSQNGWQAAFGSYSLDSTLEKDGDPFRKAADENKPGISLLIIFYLLLLIPTLILVVFSALIGILRLSVPENLHVLLSFRWAIVGGLCLLLFFFLCLQLLIGFSMENAYVRHIDKEMSKGQEKVSNAVDKRQFEIVRSDRLDDVHRTRFLSAVFWLNLLAVVVAGYLAWMDFRKTAPVPKVELHW